MDADEEISRHVSPLMVVDNFIYTLSNQDKDGRVLIYEGMHILSIIIIHYLI